MPMTPKTAAKRMRIRPFKDGDNVLRSYRKPKDRRHHRDRIVNYVKVSIAVFFFLYVMYGVLYVSYKTLYRFNRFWGSWTSAGGKINFNIVILEMIFEKVWNNVS